MQVNVQANKVGQQPLIIFSNNCKDVAGSEIKPQKKLFGAIRIINDVT